jgi:hypothetical protein
LLGAAFCGTLLGRELEGIEAVIFIAVTWLITLTAVVSGPVLLVLRHRGARRYTPNDEDVEARKKLGRQLAMPREEYQKMVREMRKQGLM